MNIALMSHDNKKELMVQFCIAYCGILSKHTVCATNRTGKLVAEATGLPVQLFLSHAHGGSQQIGARISYNEIDVVIFFNYRNDRAKELTIVLTQQDMPEAGMHTIPGLQYYCMTPYDASFKGVHILFDKL